MVAGGHNDADDIASHSPGQRAGGAIKMSLHVAGIQLVPLDSDKLQTMHKRAGIMVGKTMGCVMVEGIVRGFKP
jgi:hypothetical protein